MYTSSKTPSGECFETYSVPPLGVRCVHQRCRHHSVPCHHHGGLLCQGQWCDMSHYVDDRFITSQRSLHHDTGQGRCSDAWPIYYKLTTSPCHVKVYRNFRCIRRYFLHLLPHVRPVLQSALSMDFAKNWPTFLMSRFIQSSILRSFSHPFCFPVPLTCINLKSYEKNE